MQTEQINVLFDHLSEADPKQLRKVIDVLIHKSRLLIHNLQQTWDKLEQVQAEKGFWKESYFQMRDACEKYVDTNGLVPFNYITSLQQQLKRDKKSFKVMYPQSLCMTSKQEHKKEVKSVQTERDGYKTTKKDMNRSTSTVLFKESPAQTKFQSQHKIGPKSIQFFKFKQQRVE